MIKEARTPSTDPVQEKLRQSKALWNKEVSSFVNDLIHLKKMMNGWPSKFHQEKSKITEPIPADPNTIIGVLSGDFNDLVEKGNKIIQQQVDYSKNRRKKQPKQPSAPGQTPAASNQQQQGPDLSKQLSLPFPTAYEKFENKYGLIAEGSSKISRFFTKLFNPPFGFGTGAEIRRARMAMLNACADAYRDLGKFQVQVVRPTKVSIPAAHNKLFEVWNNWTLVSRAYTIYKHSKAAQEPDKGGTIESDINAQDLKEEQVLERLDKSVKDFENNSRKLQDKLKNTTNDAEPENNDAHLVRLESIKNMVTDYKKNISNIPSNVDGGGYLQELDAVVDKFIATKGKKIGTGFEEFYTKSIEYINKELETTGKSFKEIADQLNAKQKTPVQNTEEVVNAIQTESPIEKVAQDFLRKWVGKTMHQLSIFDKTSPYRLNCYKLAGEIRQEIDDIMDLLESGLDETKLDPLIRNANAQLVSLRGMMRSLYMSAGR